MGLRRLLDTMNCAMLLQHVSPSFLGFGEGFVVRCTRWVALTSMRYLGRRSVALSQKPPCRVLAVWAGYLSRMPAAPIQHVQSTAHSAPP